MADIITGFFKETQIYTKTGWQHVKDIQAGTLVPTMNPYTREVFYTPVVSINRYHYKGKTFTHSNNSNKYNFSITKNQKLLIYREHDPIPVYLPVKSIDADEKAYFPRFINRWQGNMPQTVELHYKNETKTYSIGDFLTLFAWFYLYGTKETDNKKYISFFTPCLSNNPIFTKDLTSMGYKVYTAISYDNIPHMLRKMGFKCLAYSMIEDNFFLNYIKNECIYSEKTEFNTVMEKLIPDFIFNLDSSLLKQYFIRILNFYLNRRRKVKKSVREYVLFYTLKATECFQQLMLKCGQNCRIYEYEVYSKGNKKDMYMQYKAELGMLSDKAIGTFTSSKCNEDIYKIDVPPYHNVLIKTEDRFQLWMADSVI